MGIHNMQFRPRFRVWRRKASKRSSTFSLRFTAIGGSVSVEQRLKVGALVEVNACTPKSIISTKIRAEVWEGCGSRVFETHKSLVFSPRGREPSYSGLFLI